MKKMIEPIKPSEIVKAKRKALPDAVIETFNKMIARSWDGTMATIRQDDIIAELISKEDFPYTRGDIFDNHFLDIEDVYRKAGWKVEYDKPGYCENYNAIFRFSK